uniref:Uncharacterized protein n=1 Tax=Anguilla anguilla TaxID=7936 RepID=A0A0E9Q2H1_ANGAN
MHVKCDFDLILSFVFEGAMILRSVHWLPVLFLYVSAAAQGNRFFCVSVHSSSTLPVV